MKVKKEDIREHSREHTKQNSWWAKDVRGIPLRRVCGQCSHLLVELYRPEVLGISGNYTDAVEEPIEPEDY